MRAFMVVMVLAVIVAALWGGASMNAALVAGPGIVESAVRELAADPSLLDAEHFAAACAERVKKDRLQGSWTVTMSSAAKVTPDQDGVRRSISARFEGTHRLPLGLKKPLVLSVSTTGIVSSLHDASHWPVGTDPLPLDDLLPGQRGPTQFVMSELNWSTANRDGSVTLYNTELSTGCELRCEGKDGVVRWSEKGTCTIPKAHLRFVSDDCERVVTIDPMPLSTRMWQTLPVARVFARSKLEYEVAAITVVSDADKIRHLHGWLRGLSDVAGEGPSYSADGKAVVFVTAEGKQHELPLVKPPPK